LDLINGLLFVFSDSVQPVMIYQGEVIVREGSQIDANAINKLKLLGLTSSSTSIFPIE
jgi:membrane-associated HD superfamily phosphohydrolase